MMILLLTLWAQIGTPLACKTVDCGLTDKSGWPIVGYLCTQWGRDGYCKVYKAQRSELPFEPNYRIDWLKPDLDLRPLNLGSYGLRWGGEPFRNIYLLAPSGAIYIQTEDGKRLVITAAEVKRRAK